MALQLKSPLHRSIQSHSRSLPHLSRGYLFLDHFQLLEPHDWSPDIWWSKTKIHLSNWKVEQISSVAPWMPLLFIWSSYGFSKPTGILEITWQDNWNDSLSSKSYSKMTHTQKKLIINHSNKLRMFFLTEPKVASPINVCRAVGVIPAGETNHFSSNCHRLCSFIICANQLSIVASWNLCCVSFLSPVQMGCEIWVLSGVYHKASHSSDWVSVFENVINGGALTTPVSRRADHS